MKTIAVMLLLLSFQSGRLDSQWGEVVKNERIAVEIERVLYESGNDPRFFIHVRIRNLASETLEVDLRDRWNIFYPNQVADIDTEQRGVIDELFAGPRPLDEPVKRELIDSFGSGKLKPIPSGGSIDYFVDYNSTTSRQYVTRASHQFIVLSIRGQFFATNGKQVWAVVAVPEHAATCEFAIPHPVTLKSVPSGAAVVTAY